MREAERIEASNQGALERLGLFSEAVVLEVVELVLLGAIELHRFLDGFESLARTVEVAEGSAQIDEGVRQGERIRLPAGQPSRQRDGLAGEVQSLLPASEIA